jgi:hypothetical protein
MVFQTAVPLAVRVKLAAREFALTPLRDHVDDLSGSEIQRPHFFGKSVSSSGPIRQELHSDATRTRDLGDRGEHMPKKARRLPF